MFVSGGNAVQDMIRDKNEEQCRQKNRRVELDVKLRIYCNECFGFPVISFFRLYIMFSFF